MMNFGTVSVRANKEANAGGPWIQPRIVQVLFQPTYLGQLEGLPTKENLTKRFTRRAENLWGKRESLQLFLGSGKQLGEGHTRFSSTTVLVELQGPVLDPTDGYDTESTAWLVMLGGDEILGSGINRAVQRLLDGYEIVWSDVAINTAP
jgi:hypothetical protein